LAGVWLQVSPVLDVLLIWFEVPNLGYQLCDIWFAADAVSVPAPQDTGAVMAIDEEESDDRDDVVESGRSW
jgi:hypothetical protein